MLLLVTHQTSANNIFEHHKETEQYLHPDLQNNAGDEKL